MATYALSFPSVDDSGQDLARRTVCIKVQRSRLGNTKKVSSSQVEVDTDKSMIRVSKHLFESKEYAAIRNFDGEIARYLEQTCLPFERGVHLCPLPLLKQVDAKMHEFADASACPGRRVRRRFTRSCAGTRPAGCVHSTIRWTTCQSNRCGQRLGSPGATSASECRISCGRFPGRSGRRNEIRRRV